MRENHHQIRPLRAHGPDALQNFLNGENRNLFKACLSRQHSPLITQSVRIGQDGNFDAVYTDDSLQFALGEIPAVFHSKARYLEFCGLQSIKAQVHHVLGCQIQMMNPNRLQRLKEVRRCIIGIIGRHGINQRFKRCNGKIRLTKSAGNPCKCPCKVIFMIIDHQGFLHSSGHRNITGK